VYEALVASLVHKGTIWAGIGCGRDVFPSNPPLAGDLAARTSAFVGIDPDPNVYENSFVSDRFQGVVEGYPSGRQFDLITMRMVAEHVADPVRVAAKLFEMTALGGHLVILTPAKWAPIFILARALPFGSHRILKQLVWRVEERDTFPVIYKMNTRRDFSCLVKASFAEVMFSRLNDCRANNAFRRLNKMELAARAAFNRVGLVYPEHCILSVYVRPGTRNAANRLAGT
jgi:SAM-dependent methyltransferase